MTELKAPMSTTPLTPDERESINLYFWSLVTGEKDMTDKEVGEVWAHCYGENRVSNPSLIQRLIRKLVEERANADLMAHVEYCRCEKEPTYHLRSALADFGIPRESWKP